MLSARGIVIACNGKFDQHLNLEAAARLYGGFACPGEKVPWTYQPGKRAQVVPSDEGTALEIRNVADAVTIEDVEFYSRDATTPGGSSIAAIIESSDDVTLARVRIVAGAAMAGADGESGTKGIDAAAASGQQQGAPASCGDGAPDEQFGGKWPSNNSCGARGGPGGDSKLGLSGGPGYAGIPATDVVPPNVNNRGNEGPEGEDGKPGSPGASGTLGRALSDAGTFTEVGFTPSASAGAGSDGFPGQGGGGGGASNATGVCIGASGGAGGMGGCGGKGGTGGLGGGASVALIAWSSALTLDACELVAQEGGAGGQGGDGGLGGLGKEGAVGGAAFSDASNSIGKGGNGGPGGNGGVGGPGAGGNGGPSIALVVHGVAPEGVASSVLTPGSAGAAGPGGSAGALVGENGKAGTSSAQLSVP
jgi:hypothetical protein